MRIAFLSHEFPPETGGGGIGTYLDQVSVALVAAGHAVDVLAGGVKEETHRRKDGVMIHRIASSCSTTFGSQITERFTQVHAEAAFDVIEGCDFDASALSIKRRFPRLPYVCKLHTPRFVVDELQHHSPSALDRFRMVLGAWRRGRRGPSFSRAKLRETPEAAAEIAAIAAADVIAAPSAAIARAAVEWVPSCADRIQVFPYPYVPAPALLSIPAGTVTNRVTFLGRIEERKGVLDLAAAIPSVLARHPGIRFRFVGRSMPTTVDGTMADELIRSRLRGIAAEVEFTGARQPAEIPAFLAETDLLVVPSHWESFGLVCCEGMAAGRAVIGSASGGMAEILDHGRCGVLVQPQRPSALADAIVNLLDHPAERRRLAEAGRARILKHYSLAQVLPQQIASYEAAIERCQTQRPN